jgi:hypothetical protein
MRFGAGSLGDRATFPREEKNWEPSYLRGIKKKEGRKMGYYEGRREIKGTAIDFKIAPKKALQLHGDRDEDIYPKIEPTYTPTFRTRWEAEEHARHLRETGYPGVYYRIPKTQVWGAGILRLDEAKKRGVIKEPRAVYQFGKPIQGSKRKRASMAAKLLRGY